MRFPLAVLALLPVLLCGCKGPKGLQTKEAVQAAIEAHLSQRSNIVSGKMTVEVEDVKFSGDTAEADAKFRSKSAPDMAVGVHYKLRLQGDNWQVESSTPSGGMGGNPHGGSMPQAPSPSTGEAPLKSSH